MLGMLVKGPSAAARASLLGLALIGTEANALPDELQIRLDDINKPGASSVDVIANYAVSKPHNPAIDGPRPTYHLLQVSPDFSWGFTKNTEIGLQLFSSVSPDGHGKIDGGRIEFTVMPIRPEDDDDDGLFAGVLMEVGHLPRTRSTNNLDGEVKFILGYRIGNWTIATNPEIGFKVSGNGPGAVDLGAKVKLAYKVVENRLVGLEYYGDLGQVSHLGPLSKQSQQLFGVVDFRQKDWSLNVGIGRGLNSFSEPWVLKAIVRFSLGD